MTAEPRWPIYIDHTILYPTLQILMLGLQCFSDISSEFLKLCLVNILLTPPHCTTCSVTTTEPLTTNTVSVISTGKAMRASSAIDANQHALIIDQSWDWTRLISHPDSLLQVAILKATMDWVRVHEFLSASLPLLHAIQHQCQLGPMAS